MLIRFGRAWRHLNTRSSPEMHAARTSNGAISNGAMHPPGLRWDPYGQGPIRQSLRLQRRRPKLFHWDNGCNIRLRGVLRQRRAFQRHCTNQHGNRHDIHNQRNRYIAANIFHGVVGCIGGCRNCSYPTPPKSMTSTPTSSKNPKSRSNRIDHRNHRSHSRRGSGGRARTCIPSPISSRGARGGGGSVPTAPALFRTQSCSHSCTRIFR